LCMAGIAGREREGEGGAAVAAAGGDRERETERGGCTACLPACLPVCLSVCLYICWPPFLLPGMHVVGMGGNGQGGLGGFGVVCGGSGEWGMCIYIIAAVDRTTGREAPPPTQRERGRKQARTSKRGRPPPPNNKRTKRHKRTTRTHTRKLCFALLCLFALLCFVPFRRRFGQSALLSLSVPRPLNNTMPTPGLQAAASSLSSSSSASCTVALISSLPPGKCGLPSRTTSALLDAGREREFNLKPHARSGPTLQRLRLREIDAEISTQRVHLFLPQPLDHQSRRVARHQPTPLADTDVRLQRLHLLEREARLELPGRLSGRQPGSPRPHATPSFCKTAVRASRWTSAEPSTISSRPEPFIRLHIDTLLARKSDVMWW
jgi:hypothetical protein